MAYTITPLSGVNLVGTTTTNTNSAGTAIPTFGPLGSEVFGSDGKRYVFVKTSGNVTASAAVVVNSSTFAATYNATGDYTAPGTAAGTVISDGTYVWVSKASV